MSSAADAIPRDRVWNRGSLLELLAAVSADPLSLAQRMHGTNAPLLAFDATRRLRCVNGSAERFFGYTPGELDGHPVDELLPARLRTSPRPVVATPDVLHVEVPGLRKDGSEFVVEWAFGMVSWRDTVLCIAWMRDSAETARLEEKVRRAEERLRLLIEGVSDHAIFLLDPQGRIASWNVGAQRLKGYSEEEILGRHYSCLFPEDDARAGKPEAVLALALREGRAETEGWRVRRDGSRFWANAVISALRNDAGEHVGFAKVTRDLTTRRQAELNARELLLEQAARAAEQAEEAARAQTQQLRLLAEASHAFARLALDEPATLAAFAEHSVKVAGDGCLVVIVPPDAHSLVIVAAHFEDPTAHEAALGLIGEHVSLDGPAGRVIRSGAAEILPALEPGTQPRTSSTKLRAFLERFPSRSLMFVPILANGLQVGVAAMFRHAPGRPFAAPDLALVGDLALRAGLALEKARLYREEQAATRARDHLLAVVSHDLRTPISTVLLAAGQLERAAEDRGDRVRALAQRIQRSGARMQRLVQDLFDRAGLELGRPMSLVLATHDARVLVRDAADAHEALAAEQGISLEADVPHGPCELRCDGDRLQQVLSNLVGNALTHTPAGGRIRLGVAPRDRETVFTVADTGPGIPAGVLPRIFEPYVQGEGSTGGLGLGLAVCRAITEAHGGRIWAESEPGYGSTFSLALPA